MAASMVVVFLFISLLHLSKYCIPHIVKQVMRYVFGEKQEEGRKKAELMQLQEEQSQLNVKEDFPKYARIERKINKIKDDMKKLRQGKTAKTFTFSWGLTLALNALQTCCLISVIWRYRYEPMIMLKEEWLWPLAGVVSFPSGIPGALGISIWILICNNILKRAGKIVSFMNTKTET
ncbi:guided entry of tail-anchored proteins factor 1-like [Asterias amurensis]|uniref:guided entry of tail-anchored proteins factor 1-like n=1 Tax=Asterias amurensis TaxID=7602 RepID=UPI003AB4B8B5